MLDDYKSEPGKLRFSTIPTAEELMRNSYGEPGELHAGIVGAYYDRLVFERNYFQERYLKADSELSRIETVVVMLKEFDANGPGDCGDRLVDAIKKLITDRNRLKELANV